MLDSWTSYNSYDIWELDVIGCPHFDGLDVNGAYFGTAALIDVIDDGTNDHTLVPGISNDEIQVTYLLYRP